MHESAKHPRQLNENSWEEKKITYEAIVIKLSAGFPNGRGYARKPR